VGAQKSTKDMPKKLTKALLDRLVVTQAGNRTLLFDSELAGFGVRVTPGARTFFVQYRAGTGRSAPKRRLSLGQYGALTLEQARSLAKGVLADVAKGHDPAATRSASKDAPTVSAFGVDYLAEVRSRRKETTAREYGRLWSKHIVPAMGSRRLADVQPADVARLHRAMRSTPYNANRTLAVLGSFFGYAERQGVRPRHSNPAHEIEPYKEQSRERFLTPAEVARLGESLNRAETKGLPVPDVLRKQKHGLSSARRAKITGRKRGPYKRRKEPVQVHPSNPFAVAAIRFLLLTGWREQEALKLRWIDLNLDRGTATLPDTKSGRSQRVIGAPARLLLSDLPRVEGSPFVFPGASAVRPLATLTRVWFAARHAAKLDDVRLHDLRHSFASVSASSGGSLLLIGKLLGHHDPSTTAKYAHLLDDPIREAADTASNTLSSWLAGNRPAKVRSSRLA